MFSDRPSINGNNPVTPQREEEAPVASLEAIGGISHDVYQIRDRVQRKLLAETEGQVDLEQRAQMQTMIENLFNQVLAEENLLYTRSNRTLLLDWVISDILGYGPLEPLLQDPSITEVMANGPNNVYIERYGLIEKTNVTFENDAHLMRIIDRIVSPLGRRVDESSPNAIYSSGSNCKWNVIPSISRLRESMC
jgi:pilus assembly protein CpaF